jgi:hypothetical protein
VTRPRLRLSDESTALGSFGHSIVPWMMGREVVQDAGGGREEAP